MHPCRLESAGDGPDAYHKPGSAEADAEFEWLSPNEQVRVPFSRNWKELLLLAAEYDLCLTGAVSLAATMPNHLVACVTVLYLELAVVSI